MEVLRPIGILQEGAEGRFAVLGAQLHHGLAAQGGAGRFALFFSDDGIGSNRMHLPFTDVGFEEAVWKAGKEHFGFAYFGELDEPTLKH